MLQGRFWPDLAALWGLLGFTLLLGSAILRLASYGLEALEQGLTVGQWLLLIAFVAFMAYSEGYRGFQLRFSPRFARRINALRHRASVFERALAPLYAMGFFRAEPRQMVVTYLLTLLIVAFIVLFRFIPQPWRGILDWGVVIGLLYGLVVSWWCVARAWGRSPQAADAPQPGSPRASSAGT